MSADKQLLCLVDEVCANIVRYTKLISSGMDDYAPVLNFKSKADLNRALGMLNAKVAGLKSEVDQFLFKCKSLDLRQPTDFALVRKIAFHAPSPSSSERRHKREEEERKLLKKKVKKVKHRPLEQPSFDEVRSEEEESLEIFEAGDFQQWMMA